MARPGPGGRNPQTRQPASADQAIAQALATINALASGGVMPESPIGVPADYVAGVEESLGSDARGRPIQGPRRLSLVEPRYFEGDEVTLFANLPPEVLIDLHNAMDRAGVIPKGSKYRKGMFQGSEEYFKALLAFANQQGLDWRAALDRHAELKQRFPEAFETPSEPLVVRPTNPEDLRAVITSVAKRTYGKNAPQDLVERLVGEWQRYETERQTFDYNLAQGIEQGTVTEPTTVTEPPAFDTWVDQRLRAADPEATAGHQLVGMQNAFFNLLDQTSGADEFSG